jgi:hypothetical protein
MPEMFPLGLGGIRNPVARFFFDNKIFLHFFFFKEKIILEFQKKISRFSSIFFPFNQTWPSGTWVA